MKITTSRLEEIVRDEIRQALNEHSQVDEMCGDHPPEDTQAATIDGEEVAVTDAADAEGIGALLLAVAHEVAAMLGVESDVSTIDEPEHLDEKMEGMDEGFMDTVKDWNPFKKKAKPSAPAEPEPETQQEPDVSALSPYEISRNQRHAAYLMTMKSTGASYRGFQSPGQNKDRTDVTLGQSQMESYLTEIAEEADQLRSYSEEHKKQVAKYMIYLQAYAKEYGSENVQHRFAHSENIGFRNSPETMALPNDAMLRIIRAF